MVNKLNGSLTMYTELAVYYVHLVQTYFNIIIVLLLVVDMKGWEDYIKRLSVSHIAIQQHTKLLPTNR